MEPLTDADDFKKRLGRTFELDRMIRSHVIYEATSIEGIVDRIISWHFCPDETKHIWFQSMLFRDGEISFYKKTVILQKLLKEFYPDIHERVPGLINKLDDIRIIRNKFAHSELVLEEEKIKEANDKGVFLRSIKDGKVVEEFISQELAEKIVNDNGHFLLIMVCIWIEVQNRAEGKGGGTLLGFFDEMVRVFPEVLERVKN